MTQYLFVVVAWIAIVIVALAIVAIPAWMMLEKHTKWHSTEVDPKHFKKDE